MKTAKGFTVRRDAVRVGRPYFHLSFCLHNENLVVLHMYKIKGR